MGVDSGPGIPGWFIAFIVFALVAGVGTTVWRISVARQIARDAGLDPNTAAAVTMLSNDGVGAAYMASALAAHPSHQPAQPTEHQKTTEERLKELENLKNQGLISSEEYEAQRGKILGSI